MKWRDMFSIIGICLICAGVGMYSFPAALITAGIITVTVTAYLPKIKPSTETPVNDN